MKITSEITLKRKLGINSNEFPDYKKESIELAKKHNISPEIENIIFFFGFAAAIDTILFVDEKGVDIKKSIIEPMQKEQNRRKEIEFLEQRLEELKKN